MKEKHFFNLCKEGEKVVKTYECTSVKKLFWKNTKGFITVTNKRVLYHAWANGINGTNIVLNEMPIDDFTGFNAKISSSLNWLFIAIISIILLILNGHIMRIVPSAFKHPVFAIISIIPYITLILEKKSIINLNIKISEKLKPVLYYLFLYGIFILGINILPKNLLVSIILYIVFIFIIFRNSNRNSKAFSIEIYSKSAEGKGIYLPGVQSFRFLGREFNVAADTMTGSPSNDAEMVISELGALITDLKHLGDHAIEMWSEDKQKVNSIEKGELK